MAVSPDLENVSIFENYPQLKEKDNKRYKVWVERCRRKYVTAGFEGKKWEPAKSVVICGLHFFSRRI